MVAVAARAEDRRNALQIVKHAQHMQVASVQHQVNALQRREHLRGDFRSRFGDVRVSNEAYAHLAPP
jgi:hypothetical protein